MSSRNAFNSLPDRLKLNRYITWIDRDPETIARQEALKKKDKLAKDDEERMAEFIRSQVLRPPYFEASPKTVHKNNLAANSAMSPNMLL